MLDPTGAALACKAIGAGIGAAVSVVFMPPETWRQFFVRVAVAAICGFIFAHIVADAAGWSHSAENMIAAAFIASFGAWWALGALIRTINHWPPTGRPPKGD